MTERKFFTPHEKAEIRRRRRLGANYSKIAATLGRNTHSIATRFRADGQPPYLDRTKLLAKKASGAMARKQGFRPQNPPGSLFDLSIKENHDGTK